MIQKPGRGMPRLNADARDYDTTPTPGASSEAIFGRTKMHGLGFRG